MVWRGTDSCREASISLAVCASRTGRLGGEGRQVLTTCWDRTFRGTRWEHMDRVGAGYQPITRTWIMIWFRAKKRESSNQMSSTMYSAKRQTSADAANLIPAS